jgi:hypothetical protein
MPFAPIQHIPTPQQIAAQVIAGGNGLFNQIVAAYLRQYNAVWNNPNASPDLIVAAMGTQAVAVFEKSAATAAYLVAMGAVDAEGKPTIPTTMPAGWNFQANADGSVTLTKQAS